jgi:hypothetical protein
MICLKSLEQPCYSDEQMEEIIPKLLMFEKKHNNLDSTNKKSVFFAAILEGRVQCLTIGWSGMG